MPTHPDVVRRRITPDEVQLQVILGSLLADAEIVGPPGARRLVIVHRADQSAYARWKHDRLGALAAGPPRVERGVVRIETIAHPLFDDLAPLFGGRPGGRRDRGHRPHPRTCREPVLERLRPLGLAIWMSDAGLALSA